MAVAVACMAEALMVVALEVEVWALVLCGFETFASQRSCREAWLATTCA
jgi:hypothetical protein